MAARKVPERVRRGSKCSAACLLLSLMLGMLLANLSGCGLPIGSSLGKHIGMWQDIRMLDAQHGWASTYLAILRTDDGGAHWHDVTPWQTPSSWGHHATFLTPLIAWVVQQGNKDNKTPAQVFRTADGGATWQHADVPDSISTFTPTSSPYQVNRSDVTISDVSAIDGQHAWILSARTFTPAHNPDNIQTIYTHVLQTSDGGTTWSLLVPNLPGLSGDQTSASASAPHINWAVLVDATTGWLNGPTPGTLLVTHDDGQTWQQRTLPALPAGLPTFTGLTPLEATQFTAPTFLTARDAILPAVTYGRAGNDAHVFYISRDGGDTWDVTPSLQLLGVSEDDYLDLTQWSLLIQSSVLYQTKDGGQHWTSSQPASAFQSVLGAHFLTSSTGWAIGYNPPANGQFAGNSDTATSPIQTTDGGKTWQAVTYSVS